MKCRSAAEKSEQRVEWASGGRERLIDGLDARDAPKRRGRGLELLT